MASRSARSVVLPGRGAVRRRPTVAPRRLPAWRRAAARRPPTTGGAAAKRVAAAAAAAAVGVDGGAGANSPPAGAERGIVCLTSASLMPRGPSVKSTSNARALHNSEAKSSRASRRRVSDTSRGVNPAWHLRAAACSAAPSPSSLSHVAERNNAASAEALPQAAATWSGVAPMASGRAGVRSERHEQFHDAGAARRRPRP